MKKITMNWPSSDHNPSSNKLLIFSIIFLLFVVGAIAFAMYGSPFKVYKNDDYGIEVRYPRDWSLKEDYEGTVAIFLAPKETSLDIFQENVNIVVQDFSEHPMTLKDYTEVAKFQLQGFFNNVKIIEDKSAKISGLPAHKITYEASSDYPLKITHFWTVKGDKVYTFTYTSELSRYNNYLAQVIPMIYFFKIK